MTEALAIAEPKTAAMALGGIEGLEGVDQGDLLVPRYKIVQPTSKDAIDNNVAPGSIYSNLSGERVESMSIVPLFWRKSRVLYREGDEQPSCKSDDALTPSSQIASSVHVTCARVQAGRMVEVCPCAIWTDGEAPACHLVYNLFALQVEGELPFILSLKGMSVKAAKRLISYCTLRRISPFSVQCRLSTAKLKNQKGTFFIANFDEFKAIEPPDHYRQHFLSLRDYDIQRTYAAEEEPEGGSAPETEDTPGMF